MSKSRWPRAGGPWRPSSANPWSSSSTRSRRSSPALTRPIRAKWTNSWRHCMSALGNRESRPRGKLVLGFRKEWLAEIDRRMAGVESSPDQGFPQATRSPRNHRSDPRPHAAGPAPAPVPADDRGRFARDHRRKPAGGRRLGSVVDAPGPLTKMWERARAVNPDRASVRPRALRVPEGRRLLVEGRARRGPESHGPLESGGRAIRSGTRCARLSHDRPGHGRQRQPSRSGRALRATRSPHSTACSPRSRTTIS